ncbi:hypothetical protein DSO57_1004223 [Entomophthora muscae]|uniref:Uncharacterized protein n=1 Tax=Entomophthora muscae TaxID=34485 RepID=A0ACC2RN58_9FUNG|nr:hypothetical protein DSO57_1004223 [Entomophthora muscae]
MKASDKENPAKHGSPDRETRTFRNNLEESQRPIVGSPWALKVPEDPKNDDEASNQPEKFEIPNLATQIVPEKCPEALAYE